MNQALYETREFVIRYRADLDLLTVRWMEEAPEALLREQYAAILEAAKTSGAGHWLLDTRRRPQPGLDLSRWIGTTWLPAAADALFPKQVCVAYLLSPLRYQLVEENDDMRQLTQTLRDFQRQRFCLQTFIDEGEAVNWLSEQRHQAASAPHSAS